MRLCRVRRRCSKGPFTSHDAERVAHRAATDVMHLIVSSIGARKPQVAGVPLLWSNATRLYRRLAIQEGRARGIKATVVLCR